MTQVIKESDFQKARKRIKEAKQSGKKVIFSSNDDELNRKVLEKEPVDVLLLDLSNRKDRMKQRDSGFNQVLAKLAKKNSVSIGVDLDQLINAKGKEKIEVLGRVRQNIELCKKDKVKMVFFSSKKTDSYNLKSLGLVLGMPTWMTKEI